MLFLATLANYTWAQEVYLPHYTTKNGLPSNKCYYTLQDQKGYLWIATDAGVSRFDGKVFENFSIEDGLPDNQILQLKEDKAGKIWFLAFNGELSYFYNGKIYNKAYDKNLAKLNLNAIIVSFFEDSKGRIWLGTNKNLIALWDGKTLTKFTSKNLKNQYINAFLHEDKAGNIWSYSTQAVHIYKKNAFELVLKKPITLNNKTNQNLANKSMAYLNKNGLNIKINNASNLIFKLDSNLIKNANSSLYTNNNELWLSTNNGVYGINSSSKAKHYLVDVPTSQILKDKTNNLWFTTTNGIYMLPNNNERLFTLNKNIGLSNNIINSITKDNKNNLWLGLGKGIINVLNFKTQMVKKIPLSNPKKFNYIKHLQFDTLNKAIYFSSEYGLGAVNNINNGKFKLQYLTETNNATFVIKSFSMAYPNKMALATSAGIVVLPNKIKNFQFTSANLKEKQTYLKDRAYAVFYDKNKDLWLANVTGLSKIEGSNLLKSYSKESLLTKRINDIKQTPNGTLVLATDGYGILLIKNNTLINQITKQKGLTSNICNKIFIQQNNIWVINNSGINKISLVNNKPIIKTFEYANELLLNDINDLYIDTDTAYFATNNGLIYFKNNLQTITKNAPKTYITSIFSGKTKFLLNHTNLILKPSQNNITFNYSAIDFKNTNITYRYKLKTDLNWTETKSRKLEFSLLAPGDYVFEIAAKNQESNWGLVDSITFTIEKTLVQTWWFLCACLLVGAVLLYILAVKITKRQKNKEQAQLLLKNKILMLEQKALQAMMNPHFVFNVMNAIQHYINTQNTTLANVVLTGFAKLIRKNLEICTKSYIDLAEETDYLNLYLSLEKNRFGNKLTYCINIDEQIDKEETLIPAMLLQPYVENAIWHGIMPKENGGFVNININKKDPNYIQILIVDNGVGIDTSLNNKNVVHHSKGMSLTQERINLYNKIEANPIQLNVFTNTLGGTTVEISIPIN